MFVPELRIFRQVYSISRPGRVYFTTKKRNAMDRIVKIDSVGSYNKTFGLENRHPLVSVVDLSKATRWYPGQRFLKRYEKIVADRFAARNTLSLAPFSTSVFYSIHFQRSGRMFSRKIPPLLSISCSITVSFSSPVFFCRAVCPGFDPRGKFPFFSLTF